MIVVEVQREPGEAVSAFRVRGHAGQASKGHDIVCAGISALTDTTVISLERLVGVRAVVKAGAGELSCVLPECLDERQRREVQLLIAHMLLGIAEIARIYPKLVEIRDSVRERGGDRVPV